MNENIIDALLNRFETATAAGYANIIPPTLGILWMLAGIALALAVVFNMFGGRTPWVPLFTKAVLIGFFSWLVQNWAAVIDQVQHTFISVGLMAGGSSMTASDFMSPSKIAEYGDELAGVFFAAAADVSPSFSFMSGTSGSIGEWLGFYLAGWGVTFGYWLTALMVFASQVVFHVTGVLSLFMLAFMAFTGTAFIGRGAIGWLVSAGTMLMAMAAITSIMVPVVEGLAFDTVDEWAARQAILASLVMIALVVASGAIARAFGNGVATMGMGAALGTGAGAAIATGAVAAGGAMLAAPAARAAMSQMNAAIASRFPNSIAAVSAKSVPFGGGSIGIASPTNTANKPAISNKGIQQLTSRNALPTPSAVSSIMIARSAIPEVADDGPNMQPTNVG